ncbi:MAG TPA: 4-(cytidine 5'-diphospho)-2-C-methyl-D-erythritol kinase [Pirellulales bacterium]|nr:4-(cytidine 5'-diphospho)-2-C-methyl-D-erythritol kinase [Pirellulales bacterium]
MARRSELRLEVTAPAKLNLLLEVLGKRGDGYHEVETLMVPVALADSLSIEPPAPADDPNGLALVCRPALASYGCPADETNLALRALALLRQRAGITHGARLTLVKRIPMAAGLGGGSSDAAAALVLGNEFWHLGWSRERLAELAAELGSDVPFFLGRGAAICRGRGERIEPIAGLMGLHFVVVKPPAGLSTAAVYAHCRGTGTVGGAAALADALAHGPVNRIAHLLQNRLQPAARELSPWIARLENEFSRVDCVAHQMSGSGTSYFGLCRNARHARRIARVLRSRGECQVFAVDTRH